MYYVPCVQPELSYDINFEKFLFWKTSKFVLFNSLKKLYSKSRLPASSGCSLAVHYQNIFLLCLHGEYHIKM